MKSNKKPDFSNIIVLNYYINDKKKFELTRISFTYEIESNNPVIRVKHSLDELSDDIDKFIKDYTEAVISENLTLEFAKKYSDLRVSGKLVEETIFDDVYCFLSDIAKSFNRVCLKGLLSVNVIKVEPNIMNNDKNQSDKYKEIEALIDSKIKYFNEELKGLKEEILHLIKE